MTPDELDEAVAAAARRPHGEGKIAELERLVAHADAAEDLRRGFDARLH